MPDSPGDPVSSRNQREGRYVGAWGGKQVRARKPIGWVGDPLMPGPLLLAQVVLPDADVARVVLCNRADRLLARRKRRYVAKDAR